MKRSNQQSLNAFFITKRTHPEDETEHEVDKPSTAQKQPHVGSLPAASSSKVYRFQASWKKDREWLKFDAETSKMYCETCQKYDKSKKPNSFRDGCTSLRKRIVEDHEKSLQHRNAVSAHQTSLTTATQRPMEKAITLMEKQSFDQMRVLFTTAYYLILNSRPFKDFKGLTDLQRVNGLTLGQTYCNDKQAKTFAYYIYEAEKRILEEKVKRSDVLAFTADGSTDRGTIDEEGVYIRYIEPCTSMPVTSFVGLKALEKSDAEHVFKAIKEALTDICPNWQEKLTGSCMDGASVNMGRKTGVATRFKSELPHVLVIHCCAHRLELAIKDTMQKVPYYESVENLLDQIFRFYKNSPLSWSSLKLTAEALELAVLKPVKATGTRWLAHHAQALEVIQKDWLVLVTHLEQVSIQGSGKRENKDKAKSWLQVLTSCKFVMFMNFLLKFFKYLSILSLIFQENDTTPDSVSGHIKYTKQKLLRLKDSKLDEVLSSDIESKDGLFLYCGKELDKPVTGTTVSSLRSNTSAVKDTPGNKMANTQVKHLAETVVTTTISHIDQRFQSFLKDDENCMVNLYSVFDPAIMPSKEEELEEYGNNSIETLSIHFKSLMKEVSLEKILHEWSALKFLMYRKRAASSTPISYLNFWGDIIKSKKQEIPHVLLLVQTGLVLPIHSAEAERGFSLMKRIKNDWRASLSTETLSSLMFVNMNSQTDVSEYKPDEAIKLWWISGKQKRRPLTQPYGARTSNTGVRTRHRFDSSDSSSECDSGADTE